LLTATAADSGVSPKWWMTHVSSVPSLAFIVSADRTPASG
jgi:hypothetical protein